MTHGKSRIPQSRIQPKDLKGAKGQGERGGKEVEVLCLQNCKTENKNKKFKEKGQLFSRNLTLVEKKSTHVNDYETPRNIPWESQTLSVLLLGVAPHPGTH